MSKQNRRYENHYRNIFKYHSFLVDKYFTAGVESNLHIGDFMKKSLKTRLTLIISAVAIVAMASIAIYVTRYASTEYTQQVEKTLLEIAKSSAKQADTFYSDLCHTEPCSKGRNCRYLQR